MRALLHALGESAPVVLVGFSIGGLFARYHASMNPDQVASLVLIDPTPPMWPALKLSSTSAHLRAAKLVELSGLDENEPELIDALQAGAEVVFAPPVQMPVMMVTAGIKSINPGGYSDELDRMLTRLQLEQQEELGALHETAESCRHQIPTDCPETAISLILKRLALAPPFPQNEYDSRVTNRKEALLPSTKLRPREGRS